ncbi:MBL fold metallo-hydrolase [Qipengyuania soli]|uniref:MBL fold metallo-hydrolase n=1 Tax=Qipengyuania soli TaxID=2782568 RepID=A0A7S8F631_9SPHN|nr:MBL fold metallo-hydrolase [Qipengyuania soli]QPC99821.1 MBL fold metallo-hydrolase [Qipengyuania soli]
MKRLAILALVVVVALGFWLGQARIGQFLFDRTVDRNVGRDAAARLPDGIQAYLCGSGSPLPDAERAGPCIGVLAGKQAFVFDAGSGAIRKLGRMGFPMERLEAGFLTHLHSDHLDGLGELMLQAWMAGGRDTPLPIYGPPGTDRVVAGFVEAYSIDRGYRIAHHGPEVARPSGFGGTAHILDPAKGDIAWQGDGVTIRVIAVDHRPVDNAYAYRIDYGGRALVISGDTVKSDALAQFAKGADVLFHEALNPGMIGHIGKTLAARGNADAAKIMADIPDYHTSPEEAAEVAQEAGVKALVLYHLVPGPPVAPVAKAFLGNAEEKFDGELRIGEDGMLVSLPTHGESIEFDDLL